MLSLNIVLVLLLLKTVACEPRFPKTVALPGPGGCLKKPGFEVSPEGSLIITNYTGDLGYCEKQCDTTVNDYSLKYLLHPL